MGPVVSGRAALAMASGVARVLSAEVSVAVTGVGGPDPQDGKRPGTVWLAVHSGSGHWSGAYQFDGSPVEICQQACDQALRALLTELG
jgi:nicotinamide-nucleotide amidase